MDQFFQLVHALTGADPVKLVAFVTLISVIARFFGPLIPDDKKGFLGWLRVALNVIGLYSANRITSGVSTSDVAKVVLNSSLPIKDPETGKFQSTKVIDAAKGVQSHWLASVLTFLVLAVLMGGLAGCTTAQMNRVSTITNAVCSNVSLAQALVDQAAESKRKDQVEKVLDGLRLACPLILAQLNTAKAQAVANQPATVQ